MQRLLSILHLLRRAVESVGDIFLLFFETLVWMFRPPYRVRLFVEALSFIGVGSLFIVCLTGTFTGMVFALQSYKAFRLFNAETLVGSTVALALTRELAPVLTSLMVTGRVGSAIATELGTMKVTEQIDALNTMAVNPLQYLVVPRMLAALIMVPILCMYFNLVGMVGAYLVAVKFVGVDSGLFVAKVMKYVRPSDITSGLIKAAVFGVTIAVVGCYKGINASGGAAGVGVATTQSVVLSSVLILVQDYFLTVLMF
ncbi:MAG: ABC transporter permease [Myxococcales bacterium]|nr:ABC transporter permease [Myxococcales bacterium]